MHYNNYCSAGVAHLVERDLAKVEVASSSLVARSKKKHRPSGWCYFFGINIHRRWSKYFIKSKISRVSSGVYPSSESCKALSMPSI